ncbi:MAG TPA: hypothetical protein VLD86_12585 [Ilumatobacteraceae bacterium]|nr:hypothetical protein [Ilumatobacteraceae bacterium]
MSHDELPLRAEVASAYLDGELEPDERAAAAADPETMALVDSLSVLRNALADVDPAAVSSRTTAIAAALAEFDARRDTDVAVPAPVRAPVTLFRRHERNRFALGAAAAAVVLIVALAVVNSGGRSDLESSSATPPAESAQSPDSSRKAAPAATEAPSILATEAAGGPEIDSPEALRQYAAATSAMDATTAMPATAGGSSATTPLVPTTTIAAAGTATPGPTTDSLPCMASNDLFLGDITVVGEPAYAARDLTTGKIKAIAAADCRVLFTVAP